MTSILTNVAETDKVLLDPFLYLCEHPGKEIRTKLISAFDAWLRVPTEFLQVITDTVEMLHTASLLIDDVEDNSELRRGMPVAHKIFGVPLTINCANYVYFLALQKLLALKRPKVVEIFTEELVNLHRGQGFDIYWRDTQTCPTEEEYLEMINHKTGGLLRLAVKLMQECSDSTTDYTPLVNILGLHFQIRDDYLNLRSNVYAKHKGFAEDLTEGKFSFPVIHHIRTTPDSRQMLNILKQRTSDLAIKSYAVDELLEKQSGSLAYTRSYLLKIEARARQEIARLGGNVQLEKVLDFLARDYKEEVNGGLEETNILYPAHRRPKMDFIARLKAREEADKQERLASERAKKEEAAKREELAKQFAQWTKSAESLGFSNGKTSKDKEKDAGKDGNNANSLKRKREDGGDGAKDSKDLEPPRRRDLSMAELMAMAAEAKPEDFTLGSLSNKSTSGPGSQEKSKAWIPPAEQDSDSDSTERRKKRANSPPPKPKKSMDPALLKPAESKSGMFRSKSGLVRPPLPPPTTSSSSSGSGPKKTTSAPTSSLSAPTSSKSKSLVLPGVELQMLQTQKRDIRSVAEVVEEKMREKMGGSVSPAPGSGPKESSKSHSKESSSNGSANGKERDRAMPPSSSLSAVAKMKDRGPPTSSASAPARLNSAPAKYSSDSARTKDVMKPSQQSGNAKRDRDRDRERDRNIGSPGALSKSGVKPMARDRDYDRERDYRDRDRERHRDRARPPISSNSKRTPSKSNSRNRDDDDEDSDGGTGVDWRAMMDEVTGNYKQKFYGAGARYSEESDGSDMEAGADEILREEKRSRQLAIREDIEEEKREREMEARERAERKALKRQMREEEHKKK